MDATPPPVPPARRPDGEKSAIRLAMGLAMELGYLIAIPAVIFAAGGAFIDKRLGTSPLFLAIGFTLAFTTSAFAIARVIKRILEKGK